MNPVGNAQQKHPIQVVARRTGLSADVIRVWERRYGAVTPRRGDTGRRLYSDADIRRLDLLRQATEGGRRIGDVAGLPEGALNDLIDADRAIHGVAISTRRRGGRAAPDELLGLALAAVDNMDPAALEAVLNEAAISLSVPHLLEDVVAPLMKAIGERWHDGTLRVSQEHMATAVIRSFLGALASTAKVGTGGPTLLVTTPAGQSHELGALLVTVSAASAGWRVVHLSPNMPAAEIAAAAGATDAAAVALSIVYPADDARIPDEIRRLRGYLPEQVAILVGGQAAPAYQEALDDIGALQPRDFSALRQQLDALRNTPRPKR